LDADGNSKKSDLGTPDLISPGKNGTIRQEDVCIRWGQVTGVKFYRVQIGEDKKFRKMFIDRFFRMDKIPDLKSGQITACVEQQYRYNRTYYWRVWAIAGDGRETQSVVRSFRLMP
jgi:hypothetical protein